MFDRAGQAVMAKIMENEAAAEALKVTKSPRFAAANAALPKLLKEKEEQEKKGKQQAAGVGHIRTAGLRPGSWS